MKLSKEKLKSLIMESLEEMHERDPRESLVDELESMVLGAVGGDSKQAEAIVHMLMDRFVGGMEPEFDPEAEAEHEKRFMQQDIEE